MKYFLFLMGISIFSFSCKKNDATVKTVEIYLLKTYQPVTGKCQVDAATAVLQDIPIIADDDILLYSKTSYWFELTSSGLQKAKTITSGVPFAVTVDKQVIYYGFFKPYISSSSCDHSITMNNDLPGGNKISVQLGYPSLLPGITIDDQRNNPQLLAALAAQEKLK